MSVVDARDFGLSTENSGFENQIALQHALDTEQNVYIPKGVYALSGGVNFQAAGQRMYGDDKWSTILKVPSTGNGHQNPSMNGVIDSNGKIFVGVEDLQVEFDQPLTTTDRSNLIQFKPGIYIDAPRAHIEDVLVTKASTGIEATKNFGGLSLENTDVSALNVGFDLGYSSNETALDTVIVDGCRFWPHKMGPNLSNLYLTKGVVGFGIGNVDDLKFSNVLSFRSPVVFSGEAFGQVSNLSLDGELSKLLISGQSSLQISGLYAAGAYKSPVYATDQSKVVITGAARVLVTSYELNTSGQSVPVVYVANPDADVQFSGGIVQQPSANGQGFLVRSGHLGVSDTHFIWKDEWLLRNKFMIESVGPDSHLVLRGNSFDSKPTAAHGPGGFIKVGGSADVDLVYQNVDGGWGIHMATSPTSSQPRAFIGGEGNDTVVGALGGDTFDGRDGHDAILGNNGNDHLFGAAGNDTLWGGSADDTLVGGGDDDFLFGQTGSDVINGGAGNDIMRAGTGQDSLYGGAGDDNVVGSSERNMISLGDGNDTARGGSGNDLIFGDAGNDQLIGDGGNDTIRAGLGFDSLYGGTGDDYLIGSRESNIISCGAGLDTANGGAGADMIIDDEGASSLSGDDGNDTILGGRERDAIAGGAGADSIYGGTESDFLSGGEGNDMILGGAGADTIVGGPNADTLKGEGGSDRFMFINIRDSDQWTSRDHVADFGRDDFLSFAAIDANPDKAGDQSFSYIGRDKFSGNGEELRSFLKGGATIVQVDSDGDRDADMSVALDHFTRLRLDDLIL